MTFDPKLAANPRQVAILAVLLMGAAYVFYSNYQGEEAATPAPARPTPTPTRPKTATRPADRTVNPNSAEATRAFRPSMKMKDQIDPLKIDPTLRTDLLARLRNVAPIATGRNIFEFGAAPAAPPKLQPLGPNVTIPINTTRATAQTGLSNLPASPPPPPPIPLKFFGFIAAERGGPKRAFLSEGEEIFVAAEGDTIRRRYRIIRINLTNILMEDTQTKSQQTIALEEGRET